MDAGEAPACVADPTLIRPSAPTSWSVRTQRRVRAALRDWVLAEQALRAAGSDIVHEMLRGSASFVEFEHYPNDDVIDSTTSCQYYYHAHRAGEHGHFHCFLRAPHLPAERAWRTCDGSIIGPQEERIAHLIAIGMDRWGNPQSLFLTNRWVTDETWYPARHLVPRIGDFAITHAYPNWAANIWLTAFVHATQPWIAELLRARDDWVVRAAAADQKWFESRQWEVVVYCDLSNAWPQLHTWSKGDL